MKQIIFYLLIILAAQPFSVFSQNCDNPEGTEEVRVYYVNGMNNTPEDRRAGVDALYSLVSHGSYSYGESVNDLEKGLKQLFEVYRQRTIEPSKFWEWRTNLSIAPEWFKEAFANYMVQSANVAYETDFDLRIMVDQYLLDLQSGKKVILVSHSQGNFYANSAYQYISTHFPDYANSIGQVAVATPSGRVQNGGPYTQNEDDVVISAVDIFYSVLPANFSYKSPSDILNHNFINTYIASEGDKIRSDILEVESVLAFPQKHPECDQNAQIETAGASLVTHESAAIEGNLTAGGQVDAWLVYGTSLVYCFRLQNDGVGEFTAPTPVIANITGLQSSKTYYYRACALGPDGDLSSGALKSFKTLPSPPPTTPTPTTPIFCSDEAYRGGTSGIRTVFDFGSQKGIAKVDFEAYSVPDKLDIYIHRSNVRVLYTPGFVSGYNYGSFIVDDTFSKVDVIVTGNANTSTLWDLTINCPN